uniref:Uncharacterized protein n=1 Tax=Oryza brachyantha TaxID=4533 RepID=J3NE66_ORYBR
PPTTASSKGCSFFSPSRFPRQIRAQIGARTRANPPPEIPQLQYLGISPPNQPKNRSFSSPETVLGFFYLDKYSKLVWNLSPKEKNFFLSKIKKIKHKERIKYRGDREINNEVWGNEMTW